MNNHKALINMIKQQLRTGEVLDEKILTLYEELPRHEFVPPAMRDFAYSDLQIQLAHNERMFTPLEEASLLQALNLTGTETVLEVGTGSGYLTAMLSRLAKQVISVDYYADFTQAAAKKLQQHQCKNVELVTGDAYRGWLDKAPYDVVVMTGAIDAITEILRLQVLPGGKLFAIVGKEPIMVGLMLSLDHNSHWQEKILFETSIPPLINLLKPKEFVF